MNSNVSSTTYLIFITSIIIVISSNYAIGILLCLHMYVSYGILVGGKQLIILVSMLT